jgi:hypothetical protein
MTSLAREAATTKEYADAAVSAGSKLGVPVVNLWKAFMAKAQFDEGAWKAGDPIPGSMDMPQNDELVKLMHDGNVFESTMEPVLIGHRTSFQPRRICHLVQRSDEGDRGDLARSITRQVTKAISGVERLPSLGRVEGIEGVVLERGAIYDSCPAYVPCAWRIRCETARSMWQVATQ